MIDLYERFGLTTNLEIEIDRFRVKLDNLLASSQFGSELLNDMDDDITWRFANFCGKRYTHPISTNQKVLFMFSSNLPLNEFLFHVQIVLDLLWDSRPLVSQRLASFLEKYFEESALSIGYFVNIYKTKSPQILPARSKAHKKKIVSALERLEKRPSKYKAALEHYDTGIRGLLNAKTKVQLKHVVDDMSATCDSLVKALFEDDNLGFKHLFKEKRWEQAKLTDTEKRIFADLNNLIDQIKHGVLNNYTKENIETVVFLTSVFIEKVAK